MEGVLENSLTQKDRLARGVLAAGLFIVLSVIFLVPPENLPFATCAFHSLTGYSCLTCGLTRSLHAISQGALISSLRFHMMGPFLFLMMILFSALLSFEAITGRQRVFPPGGQSVKRLVSVITIIWLLYWGTRLITELAA
jgi:hypothetical protein